MNGDFAFASPEWLWGLILPALILWWGSRRGHPPAWRLPGVGEAALPSVLPKTGLGGPAFLPAFLALGVALLLVALARPRLGRGSAELESSGIDIFLTMDVSGSMQAMDFTLNGQPANRLEAVKDVVSKFVEARGNDRIGIVAFAGRPYLWSPPTQDRAWQQKRISSLQIGRVEDGTAIGSALISTLDHLKNSTAKSRIIILLTDGVNNKGAANPETAAEAAKALGIKIYTIGAGTRGEAPMPVPDPFGGVQYRAVKVDVDEPMLQKIASLTGGQMFRATDTASLAAIYDSINELEKTTRKLKQYQEYQELYLYFLLPGLGLILISRLLGLTVWRRLP